MHQRQSTCNVDVCRSPRVLYYPLLGAPENHLHVFSRARTKQMDAAFPRSRPLLVPCPLSPVPAFLHYSRLHRPPPDMRTIPRLMFWVALSRRNHGWLGKAGSISRTIRNCT